MTQDDRPTSEERWAEHALGGLPPRPPRFAGPPPSPRPPRQPDWELVGYLEAGGIVSPSALRRRAWCRRMRELLHLRRAEKRDR